MTNPAAGGPRAETEAETEARMRALAAELTAAGLTARVNETRGVLDVTASLDRPGGKATEVVADDDGYVEITYWNDPGATPAQVSGVIVRALAAISAAQRG